MTGRRREQAKSCQTAATPAPQEVRALPRKEKTVVPSVFDRKLEPADRGTSQAPLNAARFPA